MLKLKNCGLISWKLTIIMQKQQLTFKNVVLGHLLFLLLFFSCYTLTIIMEEWVAKYL